MLQNTPAGGVPPTKKPGAETHLCTLRYSQIADWVGLRPRTVQQYAARGEFNSRNLEDTLRWVNARRARRGLPLIGAPVVPNASQDNGP